MGTNARGVTRAGSACPPEVDAPLSPLSLRKLTHAPYHLRSRRAATYQLSATQITSAPDASEAPSPPATGTLPEEVPEAALAPLATAGPSDHVDVEMEGVEGCEDSIDIYPSTYTLSASAPASVNPFVYPHCQLLLVLSPIASFLGKADNARVGPRCTLASQAHDPSPCRRLPVSQPPCSPSNSRLISDICNSPKKFEDVVVCICRACNLMCVTKLSWLSRSSPLV